MKTEPLRRSGKVLAVDGTLAKIEITETCGTACGGCRLSGLCSVTDGILVLEASVPDSVHPMPGEKVTVEASEGSTMRAILLMLFLPLTTLMVAAGCLSVAGASDILIAAGSFAAALTCFGISWLTGGRRKPIWHIVKPDN